MTQLELEAVKPAEPAFRVMISMDELGVLQKAGIRYSVGLGMDFFIVEWTSVEPMPEVVRFIRTMRNADKQI